MRQDAAPRLQSGTLRSCSPCLTQKYPEFQCFLRHNSGVNSDDSTLRYDGSGLTQICVKTVGSYVGKVPGGLSMARLAGD